MTPKPTSDPAWMTHQQPSNSTDVSTSQATIAMEAPPQATVAKVMSGVSLLIFVFAICSSAGDWFTYSIEYYSSTYNFAVSLYKVHTDGVPSATAGSRARVANHMLTDIMKLFLTHSPPTSKRSQATPTTTTT